MKTWHIILIFVVVAIIGMFIYLQSKKRREEEKSKQLMALLGQQQNLLSQANQSGIVGGFFGGINSTIGSAGSAIQQNPALLSFLGTIV